MSARPLLRALPGACRRWLAVALVTVIACLAGASAAQATVTASNVTAPADGTALLYNAQSDPGAAFTVSGTTNGTDGDAVDIACANDGSFSTFAEYKGPGGNGVPVAADGSFTANVPLVDLAGGTGCALLAVPHNSNAYAGPSYTGPRIAFSVFDPVTVGGSGPNTGDTYGFEFGDSTLSAFTGIEPIDGCGAVGQLFDGSAAMNKSPVLLECAGTLHGSDFDFLNGYGTPDLTRSEIEVDGQNAYGSLSAYYLMYDENDGSVPNPGFPPLTATLDSDNLSTGAAQTTETESLVECSPSDVFEPTASECSSFVPSGVSVTRVTDFSDSASVATVTDTYASTDGKAHTLDLQYETDLYGGYLSGWQLPGQTSFTEHSTGDTAGAPTSAPGTIYAIYETPDAPSFTNPVASLTFASPYDSIAFDDTLWGGRDSALIDYQRMMPANGSVSISWSYATGDSMAVVQADAAAAQASYGGSTSPPAISITSPAPGATLSSTPVTVTGIASAGSGVNGVTVNGVAATLSGGTFTASVPLSTGTNTITATVTSETGATQSASETVTYSGTAPSVAGTAPPVTPSGSGPQTFTTLSALKHLTVKVSPHHATSAPYRYKVSGALILPKGLSQSQGCKGTVTVLIKRGTKRVASQSASVTSKCTYSRTASFSARQLKGHGTLSFTITFNGNSKLDALTAKAVKARFG